MMRRAVITALLLAVLIALSGCRDVQSGKADTDGGEIKTQTHTQGVEATEDGTVLIIEVNGHTLYADFEDNSSADALKQKLSQGSITLSMSDYGGFEKVGDLPFELPRNDKRITTKPGDVILYLGDKLTIYYGVNTWEFTRIAVIRDAQSLKDILPDGDVSVTLSLG